MFHIVKVKVDVIGVFHPKFSVGVYLVSPLDE